MKIAKYKGYLITYTCGQYWALGKMFTTIKKAKLQIDYEIEYKYYIIN